MNANEAQRIIEQTFGSRFEKEKFRLFAKNLLPGLDTNDLWKRSGNYIKAPYQPFVDSYEIIGRYGDVSELAVLVVKVKRGSSLLRARTAQRNFIASYLDDTNKDAALVAFYAEDERDWRFSFIRIKRELNQNERGLKIERVLSPAYRHSYLVGPGEPHHTATAQLAELIAKQTPPDLSDIETAFSVETVTRKFYIEYRELYGKAIVHVKNALASGKAAADDFAKKELAPEHFAQRLLSQIVFLYFVQKKGWLGGEKNFLRKRIEASKNDFDYFNEVLEPLFYNSLAVERENNFDTHFGCKIPFLNGGLFEPVHKYDWQNKNFALPNSLFAEIYETFDSYNFTVREDEPLDKEVAVDPEMLGRVYESLLSECERGEQGTFYTPADIVQYICEGTLKRYLSNSCGVSESDIDEFFTHGETQAEREHFSSEKIKRGENSKYQFTMPEEVIKNAAALDDALANVAVCDPAVGSGAFLVGMMQTIVHARLALDSYLDRNITSYQLKRNCILKSLYGVDISPSATDIAKLRLWLSLIVDENDPDKIEPLPNLDYNIMQGNSLVHEFEGVSLLPKDDVKKTLFEDDPEKILMKKLSDAREKYINASHSREKKLAREILERALASIPLFRINLKRERLEQQQNEIGANAQKFTSERARNDYLKKSGIDKIGNEIFELIASASNLQKFANNEKSRDFFPWELYFADVFAQGGFDVVVENPPYVRQEKIKELKPLLKKNFSVFVGTADLFCYFIEHSFKILKLGGQLGMIVSNKWMRSDYGSPLRGFLAAQNLHELIDFGDLPVFQDAIAYPCIIMAAKQDGNGTVRAAKIPALGYDSLKREIERTAFDLSIGKIGGDVWSLGTGEEAKLLEKLKIGTMPLGEFVNGKIFYGIKTGLNEAFVIDEAKKSELIAADPKSAELIKPFLAGREIKRYEAVTAKKYLIAIPKSFTNENADTADKWEWLSRTYPAIAAHLRPFEAKAKKRDDQGDYWWELRACAYYEEFDKPKIIYAEIASKGEFTFDDKSTRILQTCYMIGSESKSLLGVLSSKLWTFVFGLLSSHIRGDFLRWLKQYIEKMPIPIIASDDKEHQKIWDEIAANVATMIALKRDKTPNDDRAAKIAALDAQIDTLVYRLYGLTAAEVAVVEGA